jgi:alginate O-acetyltransferase complex protein AlgI
MAAFSSSIFIIFFLPVVLLGNLVLSARFRNVWLLAVSVAFYGAAQPAALPVLLVFGLVNYCLGRWLEQALNDPARAKRILMAGVAVNIIPLVLLKVFAAYVVPGLLVGKVVAWAGQPAFLRLGMPWLQAFLTQTGNGLPLGFSFLVFQVVAYFVDIYKKRTVSEKSGLVFATYLTMFPKIMTGPIVPYRDVYRQLYARVISSRAVAQGARRFVIGLGKKVLVADSLGPVVDRIFALPSSNLTTGLAWLGLVGYALQIYYDFSGYSDMAIGLAQMFGFQFPENFNYPYMARSVSEFWRRWHMTLSGWFRNYVFFPLERQNKKRDKRLQVFNILVVFLLTGFWHGATPNFVVWGLLHGLAIALEQTRFGAWLANKAWRPLQHGYTLAVVLGAWIFFRAPNLGFVGEYFKALLGFAQGNAGLSTSGMPPIPAYFWLALGLGAVLATTVVARLGEMGRKVVNTVPRLAVAQVLRDVYLLGVLAISMAVVITYSYRPGLYMKF